MTKTRYRRFDGGEVPSCMFEKYNMIGSVLFVVFFSIVFLNLFVPFSSTSWFLMNSSANFLMTSIFSVVSILFLCLSRYAMYHFRHIRPIGYLLYTFWIIVELLVISCIYAFFTRDMFPLMLSYGFNFSFIPYAESFGVLTGRAFLTGIVCIAIPNVLAGMYFVIADKNRTIRLLEQKNVVTDESSQESGETIYTLFDVRGALKLSVRSSNLYYIESDDNYIKVWYRDVNEQLKAYMIRCQLKTIEDNFRGTSLIRCHRKYIVNAQNVKMLRKEPDGYFFDMDNDSLNPIPVSKTYLGNILSMFSDKLSR